ncbi:MAG: substrate-binding and VWA domain-containing protein [Actinobacteria bacterium]|nr:substrate-binding and VWA domain-containing protein [Actinomycetota bacterium]
MSATRSGRLFTGVWPRIGLTIAMFAVGIAVGVAASTYAQRGVESTDATAETASAPAANCDSDTETLQIVADDAVVSIVQDLADRYTADLLAAGRQCIPIEVQAVSSASVAGRLTNGWRSSTHGPRPDVWIAKSTMWVELLRAQLEDPSMVPKDPTVLARSPTVMAMPQPMAEQLGWPERQLSWSDFFQLADADEGWAAADKPEWGPFRLEMTDPRYTTTGLQALLALDTAQEGSDESESGTPLSLFRVQRALDNIDASAVTTLERYADADDPLRAMSATPLEEREVWRFNATGSPSPTASETSEAASDAGSDVPDLVAVYPEGGGDIAMESDYPYVLLDAPWVSREVRQFADEFGDYLHSDAGVSMFSAAGFRTRNNQPGEVLLADDRLRAMEDVGAEPPGDLPKVDEFRKLRSSWVIVPRVSRTLFLVDVSGSMQAIVPATGRTRLQETVEAAKETVQIIPNGSDVGLWEFSTELEGGEHDGDYRRLVPIGPLNGQVDGQRRQEALLEALDALDAENDTALNDTLLDAYRQLRDDYQVGRRHVILLLTDGRNDDADSISHSQLLGRLTQLHRSQEPIEVVSIAYGDKPDIDKLAEISERVGGRMIASPKIENLEGLFIEALSR